MNATLKLQSALSIPALKLQSDDRLVELAREGHEQAFEVIFDRYRRPLVSHCRRMIGEDQAQDVVQQAFTAAHDKLLKDNRELHLRAWLYQVSTNLSLNTLRQKDGSHELLAEDHAEVEQPHDTVERSEEMKSMIKQLRRLPERERHALLLKEAEGKSFEDIALILGGTPTGVKQLTYRARRRLRNSCGALLPVPLLLWLMRGGQSAGKIGAAKGAVAAGAKVAWLKVAIGGLIVGGVIYGAGAMKQPSEPKDAKASGPVATAAPSTSPAPAPLPSDPSASSAQDNSTPNSSTTPPTPAYSPTVGPQGMPAPAPAPYQPTSNNGGSDKKKNSSGDGDKNKRKPDDDDKGSTGNGSTGGGSTGGGSTGSNPGTGGSTTPVPPPPPADTTAPDTTLNGPSGTIATDSATFDFDSTEAGSTFECRFNSGAWTACTSSHTIASLGDGSYDFEVRATDAAGNTDPTPAANSFTVDTAAPPPPPDTTAPDTTLNGPSGTISDQNPTFDFDSTEAGSGFECRVDSGSWSPCASPFTLSSLADGPYNFEVRATDGAGNTDPTPASSSFTVSTGGGPPPPDTTPPDTMIIYGPTGPTSENTPTFAFAASEAASTFECRLGSAAWASCTTPYTLPSLADGDYTFEVRGTDAANNTDPTPAASSFTVTTESGGPGSGSGPFGPTNQISTVGADASLPEVALDDNGNAVAMWLQRTGSGLFEVRASYRPAGGNFGAEQILSDSSETAFYPQVAFDGQGRPIAAWTQEHGSVNEVHASIGAANGSFGPEARVSSGSQYATVPKLVVNHGGDAVITWVRQAAASRVLASIRPAGGKFGTPNTLSQSGRMSISPAPAIDDQGNATIVWAQSSASNYESRVYSSARAAGGSFGAAAPASGTGESVRDPKVAMDASGEALAAWTESDLAGGAAVGFKRFKTASRPLGGSFGSVYTVPETLGASNVSFPTLALNSAGEGIFAWSQVNPGGDGQASLQVATRASNGSVGSPQQLTTPGLHVMYPRAMINDSGDALLTWMDHNIQPPDQAKASYRPAGGSFSAPQALSAAGADVNEGVPAALSSNGSGLAVWGARPTGGVPRVEAASF